MTKVTAALVTQCLEAMQILLDGFAEADAEADHVYRGLRTLVLRLIFVLYAEARGLLPLEHPHAAQPSSVHELHASLREAAGRDPDTMHQRFGAWPRLLSVFRALHGDLDQGFACTPPLHDRAVLGVLERLLVVGGERVSYATLEVEELGSIYEGMLGYHASKGSPILQPGPERRRTSSHYTPRHLAERIVERTLEPLLHAMDEAGEPASRDLLALKICDPAMGSGAFLVSACRVLAEQLEAAWTREGRLHEIVGQHEVALDYAKRVVATTCLYGVDKNPDAVELARLSLWLETRARELPFTFLDHALKCGDSLVGLDLEQIRRLHWDKGASDRVEVVQRLVERAVRHRQAKEAMATVRDLGDLVVAGFFAADKARARERARMVIARRVMEWLGEWDEGEALPRMPVALQREIAEIRARVRPFHWFVEFPEVFMAADGMDAFVGNPPFLGGRRIRSHFGDEYSHWLVELHQGSKNADISAHFFRRASQLLGEHGTMGFVATNTIGQGDTRSTGLQALLRGGAVIYDAEPGFQWPGEASVHASVVHVSKGEARAVPIKRISGVAVNAINSRLEPKPEIRDPQSLLASSGVGFQGCILLPVAGFVVGEKEVERLDRAGEGSICRMLVGGEDITESPSLSSARVAIDFATMSAEEARRMPNALAIVRERIFERRQKSRRSQHRRYWWQYGEPRPGLREAIRNAALCAVIPRVSKHMLCAVQPKDRVFTEQLIVLAVSGYAECSVLQSRLHESWARLLSSSLEDRLRYVPSHCLATFPFPARHALTPDSDLESIGERLYTTRARYMLDTNQGLTKIYNALKDPDVRDGAIEHLRALHVELDRKVLDAYGWSEIEIPPYTDPDRAFEDEILDRLFALNAERASEERELDRTN